MKKIFLPGLFVLICFHSFSQYIGVRARYVETRLVDNPPHAPSRENRLVLSFFTVDAFGVYTPANLSDYDVWIYKDGEVYGESCGYIFDSCGNNYAGYTYTAPKVIAYYNSYHSNWIQCNPDLTIHYALTGHELDCGFIRVSYWETDDNTGQEAERFTAPNICLPYYLPPDPYFNVPGNLNFLGDQFPQGPLNWFNYSCGQSTLQLVIRGVLPCDTTGPFISLPVRFDNVKAVRTVNGAIVSWSNLTESDMIYYDVERSTDGLHYETIGQLFATENNGGRADYVFFDHAVVGTGRIYYRIKAVESSGQYIYSTVLLIRGNAAGPLFSVYPNPVTHHSFSLTLSNVPAGIYTLLLVNTLGVQTILKQVNHNGGLLSEQINLPDISAGLYSFLVRSARAFFSTQLLIE